MRKTLLKWCAPVALGVACGASNAGYTTTFGILAGLGEGTALTQTQLGDLTSLESSFRGALTSPGAAVNFEADSSSNTWTVKGSLSATMQGGSWQTCESLLAAACNGRYSIIPSDDSGSPISEDYWQGGATAGTSSFEIDFGMNIAALGFYLIDVGDYGGSVTVELLHESGSPIGSPHAVSTGNLTATQLQGSALFLSFLSDATATDFRKVRFTSTGGTCTGTQSPECGADVFGLDRITAAIAADVPGRNDDPDPPSNPAPEPATLLLTLGALAGAGGARRLRRRI